jgi:hypothetical protein
MAEYTRKADRNQITRLKVMFIYHRKTIMLICLAVNPELVISRNTRARIVSASRAGQTSDLDQTTG